MINNVDRSSRISALSVSSIKLKGKLNKLGLKTGENVIQVIEASGERSNAFVLML
jgi:hypothetical protein